MSMQYTRIPVYDDSIDKYHWDFKYEAILLLKLDKFWFLTMLDIRKLLRNHFVLETKNIDDLFKNHKIANILYFCG